MPHGMQAHRHASCIPSRKGAVDWCKTHTPTLTLLVVPGKGNGGERWGAKRRGSTWRNEERRGLLHTTLWPLLHISLPLPSLPLPSLPLPLLPLLLHLNVSWCYVEAAARHDSNALDQGITPRHDGRASEQSSGACGCRRFRGLHTILH